MTELHDAWKALLEDAHVLQADTRALVRVNAAIDLFHEALEGMAYQHCGWVDGQQYWGLSHDFLSSNELTFEILGWEDPHPVPEMRCRIKGCTKQNTVGWNCPDHRYHRTCGDHWRELEGKPHEADEVL